MHPGELQPIQADEHVQGPEHAPLELVWYGDFECRFCRMAFPEVERVRELLGDRLRFAYRHFPLPKHPHARLAAEASEAAGVQGHFWPMYHLLFTRLDVVELRDPEGVAEELGLDVKRFIGDVSGKRYARRIEEQQRGGVRAGVEGTPTFFINGRRFEGDWRNGGLLAALGGDTDAAWY